MPPIALTPDTTGGDIIEHLRTTLESAQVSGVNLFKEVRVIDDIDSFRNAGDALSGVIAGIYTAPAAEGDPTDNSAIRSYMMSISLCAKFTTKRAPGADERAAMIESNRLTDLMRQAVLFDRSRGGKAKRILWGGQVIDGTELDGTPRLDYRKPNQAFYICIVPIMVAWEIAQ
jgi:hypothetical protein